MFEGIETRDLSKARQQILSGPGVVACLRARHVDPTRIIPASEFVSIGRRFLGIEEPIDEVPLLRSDGCQHASRAHMPPSRRAGKPASSATTVVHALSRTFKRLSIRHQVESRAPFNADRNLRMDVMIERGEASETLRRQSTATRRYSSTSRRQTPKRGSTYVGWQR